MKIVYFTNFNQAWEKITLLTLGGPLIFKLYVNDTAQAVDCALYLYADDSCFLYKGNDIKLIENNLNRNFNSIFDWFVEIKLLIHFGEGKTKIIIYSTKWKLKSGH